MASVFDDDPYQRVSDGAYGVVKGGLEALKDPTNLLGLATGPVGILAALATYSPEAEGVMIPKNFGGNLAKYRTKFSDGSYHLPTGQDTWTGVANPLERVAAGEQFSLPEVMGANHPAFQAVPGLERTMVGLGPSVSKESQYIEPEIEYDVIKWAAEKLYGKPLDRLNKKQASQAAELADRYRRLKGEGIIELAPDSLATEPYHVFAHELNHAAARNTTPGRPFQQYSDIMNTIQERIDRAFKKRPSFKENLRIEHDPDLRLRPSDFKKSMAWNFHPEEQASELNALLDTGASRSARIPGLRLIQMNKK